MRFWFQRPDPDRSADVFLYWVKVAGTFVGAALLAWLGVVVL